MSRANWQFTDPIFRTNGNITSTNTNDMYFFKLANAQTVAMKLRSTNSNYVMRLCTVDWNAGVITPVAFDDFAGDEVANIHTNVPAGEYAFYIYSVNNTVNAPYTLMYNGSNPNGAKSSLAADIDLTMLTLYYGNSKIYTNGVSLLDYPFTWSREDTFYYDEGYNSRNHDIDNVKFKAAHLGRYESTKQDVNNALFLELDVGTQFTFFHSIHVNGGTGSQSTFIDSTGRRTPRYLDELDCSSFPSYLVIDMSTNTTVDFASPLNWHYFSGNEKYSTSFYSTNI